MAAGVSMLMPESILIDPDVTVGPDTLLEPGVQVLGKSRIGAGCTIATGSILSDVTLGDGVLVKPYSRDLLEPAFVAETRWDHSRICATTCACSKARASAISSK